MTFTIDVDNNITVLDSTEKIEERQEGTEIFSSSQELDALAGKWPGSRLVEIWNTPAWRGTSRAVHQPAGSRRSDLEGHPEPAAYRWRTAAAGGAEEGKCGKQGQPPTATGRARPYQDGQSNRAAATA